MTSREVVVTAMNVSQRLVVLEDGQTLHMTYLHEEDGEETDNIDDAAFATVQMPEGDWITVIFSHFEPARPVQ